MYNLENVPFAKRVYIVLSHFFNRSLCTQERFFSFSFLRYLQRWLYRSPSVCGHFASCFFFLFLHTPFTTRPSRSSFIWLCSDHFDWFVLNDITQLNECTFCSVRQSFARLQSVPLPPSRIFLPPFVHSHSSYIYFLYSYYTLLVFYDIKVTYDTRKLYFFFYLFLTSSFTSFYSLAVTFSPRILVGCWVTKTS